MLALLRSAATPHSDVQQLVAAFGTSDPRPLVNSRCASLWANASFGCSSPRSLHRSAA